MKPLETILGLILIVAASFLASLHGDNIDLHELERAATGALPGGLLLAALEIYRGRKQ